MINALGVLGYGVGGIEAEAVLLGQPLYQPMPRIVGVRLHGELPRGSTATDLVLVVTEMLRAHGVVGAFVEFAGDGLAEPVARGPGDDQQHEPGVRGDRRRSSRSTTRRSPYLRLTGRSAERIALVERYAKEQGLWREPGRGPAFDETLELDLATVEPSVAGPRRPQDRVLLSDLRANFRTAFPDGLQSLDEAGVEARAGPAATSRRRRAESFPASDPPSFTASTPDRSPAPTAEPRPPTAPVVDGRSYQPIEIEVGGEQATVRTGSVAIAAITSCTNTSNPTVMVGAGLLARNAVARGLTRRPVGQDVARARARRPSPATSRPPG